VGCLVHSTERINLKITSYVMLQCAKDLDVDNIKRCINGSEGLKFLSEMGNKTSDLNPSLDFVPAIAINMVRKATVF
jgi:hypothetical protein